MVTILEPRETIFEELPQLVEHVEQPPPRREPGFMAYTVPFPGVKYYAFEPRRHIEIPLHGVTAIRETLTARLIDEKVILI